MIAEAIDKFASLVRSAAKPERIDVKDPRAAHFVVNDEVIDYPLPVPPRDHKAGSLADLIELANRFATDNPGDGTRSVWYDHTQVVLVIDDDGHRIEKATLPLEESDVFGVVLKLRDQSFEHKAFIRLLRIKLAGCLDPVRLLNVVRRVKFENGTVTSADKQRQRESMGREITAAVSAEGEIPEEVTLAVPVFKTLREDDRWPLRCTVEVEPLEGVFRLVPLPDEIERVRNLALESIEERLAAGLEKNVPHYFGRP